MIIELRKTARFARWLDELRDLQGRARIQARLLLAGGSKHTQPADIKAALQLARGLSE